MAIKGVSADNKLEFKKLFDLYFPALYLFARKLIQNPFDAEDIVQDVFINLWNNHNSGRILNIRSFLYTSVKNSCLKYLEHERVIRKHVEYSQSEHSMDEPVEHLIIEEETYRLINNAICTLPPECRKIMMYSVNGLRNSEIAKKLSISENTVKTQKKIAYKQLRIKLKDIYLLAFLFTGVV